MTKTKIAIVGFGGIARVHYAAYHKLIREGFPLEIVAVCEKNTESLFSNVKTNLDSDYVPLDPSTHVYGDIEDLIAKEDFDAADVCLPTFLHAPVSIRLLQAGKHVLCEKPMALSGEDSAKMVAAAKENERCLMIGQCLRYDACYRYLRDLVRGREFGELRHLYLFRHITYPRWGSSFASAEKTGGCILDTHIHDVDIARFLLGEPEEASAVYYDREPYTQVVNSRLRFGSVTVIADCSWDESREKIFEAGYRAAFDKANVIYDGEGVKIYPLGEPPHSPALAANDRIAEELRAFCLLIRDGRNQTEEDPAESACLSVRLVEALRESAKDFGKTVKPNEK